MTKLASCMDANSPRRVKAFLLGSAIFLAFACLPAPQLSASAGQANAQTKENPPDFRAFVGTWKASFRGEVFAVLTLKEDAGGLAGTMNNFDVGVDKEGNLDDDTHRDDGEAPLLSVHFKSGALFFVVLEKDSYHSGTSWKFVPTTSEKGELTLLGDEEAAAPGNRVVKPIVMVRERAKP